MKLWVGTTDNNWFAHLAQLQPDEVNFWQPSGRPPFTGLPPGTPFLFKLKAPHNHIAGGGYFLRYEPLPLSLAWDAFEEKNGSSTLGGFQRLIAPLLRDGSPSDPIIGCTMLANPFFLPRERWIPAPVTWSRNIVVGKTFDTAEEDGKALWEAVRLAMPPGIRAAEAPSQDEQRYGTPMLVAPRLGQSSFRALVAAAYERQCAITGETTLPTLEAAHIRPYNLGGPHDLKNGLLLRADFHKLFDRGLVTVTSDRRVQVSDRIKDQWFNGKAYSRLHGEQLKRVPQAPGDQPDPEQLRWHNDNVFEKLAS